MQHQLFYLSEVSVLCNARKSEVIILVRKHVLTLVVQASYSFQ